MEEEIRRFCDYLDRDRHMAGNTLVSYERDLKQMCSWMRSQAIMDVSKVNNTTLTSYVLMLERDGKAPSTVSRIIASMRAFFAYERDENRINVNPARELKAPHVVKRAPKRLDGEDVRIIMEQTQGSSAKVLRDKAMLELLYSTGIKVSQIIELKLSDIDCSVGYVMSRDARQEKALPFGVSTKDALLVYIDSSRPKLLRGKESDMLFVNCSGDPMSRQGLWKIIKYYGNKAGLNSGITPRALQHSRTQV